MDHSQFNALKNVSNKKCKKKVLETMSKFHLDRVIKIKHLPKNITENEVRNVVSDLSVKDITIVRGVGSSSALVKIGDLNELEQFSHDSYLIRGRKVPAKLSETENLLCVANLPLQYTEQQFQNLVSLFGQVHYSFLMISEKSGESKGYGFVKYQKKETCQITKYFLDHKVVGQKKLVCDFVGQELTTFESLHSKCLYVNCLPKKICNLSELRKVFSTVAKPTFCQVPFIINSCCLDWGLVEYNDWRDAESTQRYLNGCVVNGQNIIISYCMPGILAMNIYLSMLNKPTPEEKSMGLIPEPTQNYVSQYLAKIYSRNPKFALDLKLLFESEMLGKKESASLSCGNKGESLTQTPLVPQSSANSTQAKEEESSGQFKRVPKLVTDVTDTFLKKTQGCKQEYSLSSTPLVEVPNVSKPYHTFQPTLENSLFNISPHTLQHLSPPIPSLTQLLGPDLNQAYYISNSPTALGLVLPTPGHGGVPFQSVPYIGFFPLSLEAQTNLLPRMLSPDHNPSEFFYPLQNVYESDVGSSLGKSSGSLSVDFFRNTPPPNLSLSSNAFSSRWVDQLPKVPPATNLAEPLSHTQPWRSARFHPYNTSPLVPNMASNSYLGVNQRNIMGCQSLPYVEPPFPVDCTGRSSVAVASTKTVVTLFDTN